MDMKIGLVSCVLQKKDGIHRADSLYASDLFKKSFAYASKVCDKVFILSAKYHLLNPSDLIENYNLTLNDFTEDEKKRWAYQVYKQLINILKPNDEIVWFAGDNYRKYLQRVLKNKQTVPLKGLRIGKQLKWYKDRL